MHDFQPYPIDVLEVNPFTKLSNEWAALVTEADGKVNAMTVSWGGIGVLWGKNTCTIYVRDSRYTKELLDKSDTFSLCFFGEGKKHSTLQYLGKASGRNEDKIAAAGLEVNHAKDIAFLDTSNFVFLCKKLSATKINEEDFIDPDLKENFYSGKEEGNFHTMYIGEIVEVLAR